MKVLVLEINSKTQTDFTVYVVKTDTKTHKIFSNEKHFSFFFKPDR